MEKGKGKKLPSLDKASGSRPKSPESQRSARGKGQSSSKGSSKSGADSKQPSSRSVKAKPKSPDPAKAPSAEDSGRDETSDPLPDAERDPLESVSEGPKNAPEELEEEPSAQAAEEAAEEPSERTVEALVETAAAEDLAADGDFLSHVASVHRSLALAAGFVGVHGDARAAVCRVSGLHETASRRAERPHWVARRLEGWKVCRSAGLFCSAPAAQTHRCASRDSGYSFGCTYPARSRTGESIRRVSFPPSPVLVPHSRQRNPRPPVLVPPLSHLPFFRRRWIVVGNLKLCVFEHVIFICGKFVPLYFI